MQGPSAEKPGIVPFSKFFAVLGFAFFCFLLIPLLLESLSWLFLSVYRNYWSGPLRRLQATAPRNRYACRGTGNSRCALFADPNLNMVSASPAYEGYPWAEDFWREERARAESHPPYEPFRVWGMAKPQGKYINVDDTGMGRIRRTVNKLRSDCDKQTTLKVWFFGGSTAWGKGAPDFATIPSYLSAKLNAQGGVCVELINLGVDAYNTNQELIYLTQQLKSGWRPEVVIFYDGYNDAAVGAFRPALPEAHFDYTEIKTKFESAIINWPGVAVRSHPLNLLRGIRYNLRGRHLPLYSQEEWISRARRTLDNYEFNLELARVLAKSYRFKVHFFWQPTSQYGTKPLDPFEKAERDLWPERQAIQAVYQEAERRSAASKSFIFLGRIFDQVAEPLYIDQVHLGPQGNEIVAGAIARVVCSTPPFSRGRQAPDARN